MSLTHLLFSFQGRINRRKFWLGNGCVLLIGLVIFLTVAYLFGSFPFAPLPVPAGAPEAMPQINVDPNYILASGVLGLFTGYMFLSISAKRLHDRGKSAWWLLLFLPSYLISLYLNAKVYAAGGDMTAALQDPTYLVLSGVSGLIGLGVLIWWLIDLGLMEGQKGPNRYGPDPLPNRV